MHVVLIELCFSCNSRRWAVGDGMAANLRKETLLPVQVALNIIEVIIVAQAQFSQQLLLQLEPQVSVVRSWSRRVHSPACASAALCLTPA